MIYLHANTEFSFLNSTIKISEYIQKAKELDFEFLAITDKNNLFGMAYFVKECQKNNIKPIVGLEISLWVESESYQVILYPLNHNGYELINSISFSISQGQQITLEQIDNPNIVLVDHMELGFNSKARILPQLKNTIFYQNLSSNDFNDLPTVFIPSKNVFSLSQEAVLDRLVQIKGDSNLPFKQKYDLFDQNEFNNVNDQIYQNTIELANKVVFSYANPRLNLAQFSCENNIKIFETKINQGLKERSNTFTQSELLQIPKRLQYEFEVIQKLNFIDYFLIIQDVIEYAKSQNIGIGPGRGSAAGSLVSYLLGITNINPLRFDLLFERFLNPERVSWPDIDIDVQDDKRELIAQYIANKYGREYCCYISTFQTIGAKMAIRDIGRTLSIPLSVIDGISKSLNDNETLEQAYEHNQLYRTKILNYPQLHDLGKQIEGLPRQQGTHPAGIIITRDKISQLAPLYDAGAILPQVQVPLNFLEDFGLLKIDFLGLKNLTIIKEIESLLKPEMLFDNLFFTNSNILNDPKTLMILNAGHTEGIFQVESPGMKKTIRKVGIHSFDDLYTIISLFRPGPMEYIDVYAKNKRNPSLVQKIEPNYDRIVENTYGIIVYQEQIMQIAQDVVGMSFGQADLLRRAISKKDEKKMHEYKKMFFELGLQRNIKVNILESIYSNIEKFADYGFNKSHAVAYAYLTFKMAYYKAHYNLIFFKALITNAGGTHATLNRYIQECRESAINVYSPEINNSGGSVRIVGSNLFLSFYTIKGIGKSVVDKLLTERVSYGKYQNFIEAYLRLRLFGLGESILQTLIKANVFRNFANSKTLLASAINLENFVSLIKIRLKKVTDETQAHQIIKEEIEKVQNIETIMELHEADLVFDQENEVSLLGNRYNTFPTIKYESDVVKLNCIRDKEVRVVARVNKFFKARGKEYYTLELGDSSLDITIFINASKYQDYETLKEKELIWATLKRSINTGKYYLVEWEKVK
ncbi:DNA polymerase III subunit alpha [Mycoplasmopsis pullorum]|nr:DNA polymerase III subunit alpha [Mycoplasmopsis pullorum]